MMDGRPIRRKIVIDTDAGLDDAQAILMALTSDTVEVVAITTVLGNTEAPQVANNVLRILKVADRLDIPLYIGCNQSLNGYMIKGCKYYHGYDGLGDCPDEEAPDLSIIKKEDGVDTLIQLSKEYTDLTLICLGPLTNIVTALQKDKKFGSRLKECYIMGGNYYGKGNITPSAEFNFSVDPEAARDVLMNLSCPKTLLGWEVCIDNPHSWDWYNTVMTRKSPKAQFISKLDKFALDTFYKPQIKKGFVDQEYVMADQNLMAVALDTNVCVESMEVYADVELKGELTRGQMVVDWMKQTGNEPNVKIVTKIDRNLVESMVQKALE